MDKKINLIITVLLFSSNFLRVEAAPNFLKKWMATPLVKDGSKEAKVFKRYIGIGNKLIPVATITYFKLPKNGALPRNLGQEIEAAFGGENWSNQKKEGYTLIEGDWIRGNRKIRYLIRETRKDLIITMALFRFGYADSTLPEIIIIQNGLTKDSELKKTSFWNIPLLHSFGIASAYAAPLNGLFGGTSTMTNLSPQEIKDLTNSLENFNTSFESASASLNESNINWAETNTQLGQSNENWAESNRVLDSNMSETNRQFARSNDIAAKLVDPKHMFKLAAATSAGAVFGASLANMLIDGVTSGAKWVVDLITDSSGKAKRWELFKEARNKWEETLDYAQKLEKLLDQFLTQQEMMKKIKDSLSPEDQRGLSREALIRSLSIDNRKLKKNKRKLERLYDETESPICEEKYASQLHAIEKHLKRFKSIENYLGQQTFKIFNEELFCSQLNGIWDKLAEAEAMIQTYRLDILNSRGEWATHNETVISDTSDKIERMNKKSTHKAFYKKRVSNAEDAYDEFKDMLKDKKKTWITNCWQSGSEKMRKRDENKRSSVYKYAYLGKSKKACRQEYQDNFSARDKERLAAAKKGMAVKIKMAKKDLFVSLKTPVELNRATEDQRLKASFVWFKDLEEQQSCYVDKEKKSCKDGAKVRFMGPFYAKDRAKVKLENICHQKSNEY